MWVGVCVCVCACWPYLYLCMHTCMNCTAACVCQVAWRWCVCEDRKTWQSKRRMQSFPRPSRYWSTPNDRKSVNELVNHLCSDFFLKILPQHIEQQGEIVKRETILQLKGLVYSLDIGKPEPWSTALEQNIDSLLCRFSIEESKEKDNFTVGIDCGFLCLNCAITVLK